MRTEKKKPLKDKEKNSTGRTRGLQPSLSGYGRKTALLEEAITQMNEGRYGKASTTLKELLALDPHNMEARRLFATLHLRLGSLLPARQAFDSLIEEAFARQDYWLAESLLREYLSVGPRCVPYLEKLGMLYQEKGQIMEAVAEYAKAIEILIEDPDPDDPDYASRLYRRIKELAPASPTVIRLNRYFDPDTGALIANPIDDPSEPSMVSSEQGDQSPPVDFPGGREPAEFEPESESTVGVESQGTEWSNELSPLVSMVEQPLALELERRDREESLEGEDTAPQIESTTLDDRECGTRDVTIETAIQWPLDEPRREEAETPSGSIADGLSPIMVVPDRVVNGHATASCEAMRDLSPLTTDEKAILSTDGAQLAEADPPSPALGLGEGDQFSVAVEEGSSNPEFSLMTEGSLEIAAFPDQPTELPEEPVHLVTALEGTEEEPVEGEDAADQRMENGEGTSSITRTDGLKRMQEPWEADDGDPLLVGETTVPPVDKPIELVNELVEPAKEAIEAELPPALSVASEVDSLLLEGDTATGPSVEGEPSPDERVPAMPLEVAVPEGQMWPASGDPSLASYEKEREEQSVAASLDQPEESAHTIAMGPEEVQTAEPSWGHEQGINQELEPSPEAFFPFTSSRMNVEEREQESEAGQASEQRGGTEERAETEERDDQEQQAQDHTESFGADSPPTPETGEVGGEERDIDWAEEQGAEAAIASEATTWLEGEPHEDERTTAVGSDDADRSLLAEEQVLGARAGGQLEAGADDPVAVQLQEKPTEPELLEHGVTEEVVSPVVDAQVPTYGPGQAFATRPSEPALSRPSSKDANTTGDRSQPPDSLKTWPPQETVHPSAAGHISALRTGHGAGVTRSTVAEAVEVLFNETASSGLKTETGGIDWPTKRLRIKKPGLVTRIRNMVVEGVAVSLSTTSLIALTGVVLLCVLCVGAVLAIGMVGLTWLVMEESPSVLYQHVTTAPPRTVSDPQRNGYLVLVGFNVPEGQDPLQAGLAMVGETVISAEGVTRNTGRVAACVGGVGGSSSRHAHAAAAVLNGWMRGSDPLGAVRANRGLLRSWMGQAETALSRYRQWQQLPFEDWGFGKAVAPPCDAIAFAHHLYLAEGFLQEIDTGIDRLETDTEAWRTVLAQARTLPVKVLAIQAVRDNAALASALLADPDVDAKSIGRLAHMFKPLNPTELSIRWPMHSELAFAASSYEAQLEAEMKQASFSTTTLASWFPLPKQRRLNAYATYYDAAFKAANANEGWQRGWPKRSDFVRFPAETMKDVLVNPIENLIGLPPLPAWDDYAGMVTDVEAHLRLVGLQAWIRRGGGQVDLFARIAKAGQGFYDPYTGLPMLVNLQKGVLYSIGHDGKDQDGDPQYDVVVAIPSPPPPRSVPSSTALFGADSQ
ncbi:MAG: hypothetical protein NNA23_03260 [Nitrospira sp.]|nr:hypothetical protein [Nitrospira sp.]